MIMGYGRHVGQYARLLEFFVICVAITGISARYVWKTGLWRECQHYSCGRGGTQYRSVFCGEEGEYNYNSVNDENCRYMQKPKEVRECFKVCDEHHSQLRWVTTTWSKCKLNPDFKECAKNKGIQYRNVTCAWRRTGFTEDDSVCSEFAGKPPDRQQCDLKCPQDCVVSQFSKWQFCDTCKFLNKTRTRALIVPAANDGQECPAFTEMIPCNNCTDTYTYQIGPWDECAPLDRMFRNQGGKIHSLIGFQKRNIRCLNSFGSVAGYKSCIDHVKTYNHDELTDRQTCIIPQDCVVSQWSAWNPINTSCIRLDGTRERGFMVRKREVEKIPLSTGAPCPDLVQYSELEDSIKKNCPKTKWITSSWGDCETPPGSLQCTTGLQTRNTICVLEDDRAVLKKKLDKGFKLDLEVLLEKENVPLPEQPKDDESNESVKESVQSDQTVSKKTKQKPPAMEKEVSKTKRKASGKGKENKHKNKKQKKDEHNDSFSDEYPEEHDLSHSILKMRRGNNASPANLEATQQDMPPLHQIPLTQHQQSSSYIQQQPQSQHPHLRQQQTPTNQQQLPTLHQQQYVPQQPAVQQWSYQPQQQQPQIQQQNPSQQWPTHQQEQLTQQQTTAQQWPSQQWPAQTVQNQQWLAQKQQTPLKEQPRTQNLQYPDVAAQTQQNRVDETSISGVFRDAMETVNEYTCDAEFTDMSSTSTPTHGSKANIHQRETPQVSDCHSCCKKVEFLTKEFVELRKQVQQLQGRGRLSSSRCNSSSTMSDESTEVEQSETHMNLTRPWSSQPVRPTSDQHNTTEKEKLKETIRNAIGNEKRVAHATRKAMTSVFSLAELTTCSMKGLHTNKTCSNPRPGLPALKRITVQEHGNQKPTRDRFCTQSRPLTSQICRPECDLDCTVTQWTEWSECKVTDCEEYLRRRRTDEGTGQRHRTREKLMANSGSGERCPHLDETQMCDPQPCYHWNITVERCMLLKPNVSPACGLGTAYRTLACVNKIGLRVSDTLCEELEERPDAQEDCNIPCPRDCILSPWSPWSDCPNQCQEERTSPSIRLRQRNVLAQQGPGGAPCPPNRQLEEAQPCSTTIECAIYVWQTDPWGACVVLNKSNNCGEGRQNRDVNCYSLLGQLVSDQRCTLKVRPDTSQACVVPCPIDCVMTDFSDWSDCSATCWEAKQTVPVQTRLRYILQTPRYGGKACPSKITDVRQCTDLPICQGFYWETAEWSRCILPLLKIPQCGPGLMARDVSCKAENGTVQPLDICIRHKGPIPAVSRPCYRSCDEECSYTDWSEWSSCINGCNGKRFKTRKLIENPKETTPNPLCQNRQLYPVDLFERCLCDAHLPITVGNWSQCILEPTSEIYYKTTRSFPGLATPEPIDPRMSASLGVNPVCGPGKRYKVLACQNDRGEMEAANQCSLKPYEEETCLIPCPVDCIMSDWSPWSDCSTSCETGTQMRYRHIKQIPSDGGRLCPALDQANKETQTRICNIDCRRYQWRVYKWSVCMPYRHERQCGNGTQSRIVRCEIFTSAGFTNEVVEEQRCYSKYKPRENRDCYSPCVGECVLSEWSAWSKCSQPCTDPRQIQVRRREILRNPVLIPGNRCPDLLEERLCVRGENCIEYKWKTSEWTSCLVNQGLVECGPGHRERYAICRDHQGFIADSNQCKEALRDFKDPLVDSCEIPCDVDCLLTEWSPWTECSTTCGIGHRTRQRAIVQEPKGNGRVCPTSFNQTRPCFEQGCYTWVVSPWSECMSEVGLCGHGIQTRNVTCVADGGLLVNMSNCAPDPNVVVTKTERNCEVPCPGECVMTDWTGWNDCFVDCKDFNQGGFTKGVQSRSRAVLAYAQGNHAPCPDKLWESRPCKATTCQSFIWRTSRWTSSKGRRVWCEKSDGLLVTGGCSELSRPPEILACTPPCSVPNSYCNDTDYCVCESQFTPVIDRLNALIECVMDNSSAVPVSPRTVSLPEDGVTNVWMYAVIAAGTFFVIFLAVGCYTMSEYFHKGPRSRRMEERKQVEGGDNIDGMIAETTLISCNHVAPIATANELDNISAISADRSSTDSVGACNGHVLAGGLTARACREHAHTEGYAHVHDDNKLDVDHVEGKADVVRINGDLQHEHALDLDVVTQSNTACMIPKSKSSSALRHGSDIYSVVKKDNTRHLGGRDRCSSKNSGNTHNAFGDNMHEFKEAKKSKSDAEVAHFANREYDIEKEGDTMHGIKSPSLRNLLQSFIGKIDTLSPKSGGDGYEFSFDKSVNDNVFHSDDTELAELAPLLVDPNDSGLASAPSPQAKLEDETSSGSGNVFCVSCGQKQSDMSDISLQSFDRASSLRSYNPSIRSDRMKSLSRNSGPVIQIVPEETVISGTQNMSLNGGTPARPLKNLFQTGLESIPKQTVIASHNGAAKIGYTAFSSIDTETSSVAPSTSVSNGSLDSAADMTSDQSAMDTSPKSPEQLIDRSRNVAIDSLRNAKHSKPLKDLSPGIEDSGLGASVGFDTNDEYFKTLDNGINGKDYIDEEILDDEMQTGSYDTAVCEPLIETTVSDALEVNPVLKPKRVGASASPNGRESNNLITPSAYLTGNIMMKRQALCQSHDSVKLDLSE